MIKQCLLEDRGIGILEQNFTPEFLRTFERNHVAIGWEFILYVWSIGKSQTIHDMSIYTGKEWYCNYGRMITEAAILLHRTTYSLSQLGSDLFNYLFPILYRVPTRAIEQLGLLLIRSAMAIFDLRAILTLVTSFRDHYILPPSDLGLSSLSSPAAQLPPNPSQEKTFRGTSPPHHLHVKILGTYTCKAILMGAQKLRGFVGRVPTPHFLNVCYHFNEDFLVPLSKLGGLRDRKEIRDEVMRELNEQFPFGADPEEALAFARVISKVDELWDHEVSQFDPPRRLVGTESKTKKRKTFD